MVHRSGIGKSHAQEGSTAREFRNLMRGDSPPLGNRRISRAVAFHRPEVAESHARERLSSTNCEKRLDRVVLDVGIVVRGGLFLLNFTRYCKKIADALVVFRKEVSGETFP